MVSSRPSLRLTLKKYLVPGLVLLAGLIFSGLLFQYLKQRDQQQLNDWLTETTQYSVDHVRQNISNYENTIHSTTAFYQASERVERHEFHSFAREFINRHPGILSMEWLERVPRQQRDQFPTQITGFTEKTVTPGTDLPNDELTRTERRAEYFPITFQYPPNKQTIGFDHASHSPRRKAIHRARDEGRTTATQPLNLFRQSTYPEEKADTTGERGLILFQPLYKGDSPPSSVSARRSQLRGLLSMIITVRSLLVPITHGDQSEDLKTALFTGQQPSESDPFFTNVEDGKTIPPSQQIDTQLSIADQVWTLRLTPTQKTVDRYRSWIPLGALLLGFLVTGLLSRGSYRITSRIVGHEEHFESLVETSVDAIVSADERGRIILWNESAEAMFGYSTEEILGEDLTTIMPERYRQRHTEGFNRFLETGEGEIIGDVVELEGLHRDGHEFPVELALAHWTVDSKPRFTAVIRDRSELTHREEELSRQKAYTQNMIDSLPDLLYLFDREGNMLEWNDELRRVTGYSDDEIEEMNPLDFIPPRNHEQISEAINRVFDKQVRQLEEAYLLTKTGERIPYEFTGTPLYDGDGDLIGLMGTGRDISQRKKAQQEIQRRERRYRNLVEEVEDYAIFRLDREGRVSSWNTGAEKIKGYSQEEIMGEHVSIFYPEEYLEEGYPQRLLDRAKQEGRVEHEGWRLRKDGSRFWASVVITAIHDRGEFRGYSKVVRDLTERKNQEEQLERLNKELEKKVKKRTEELEQFIYAASHDLAEPARVMGTYAGFLEEDVDDLNEDAREDIEFIQKSATHMNELIEALLKLSRTSRQELNLEDVDLNDCVDRALEQLSQLQSKHDVTTHRGELPVLTVDRALVTDLYQNLLSNAMKYCGDGEVEIWLTAEQSGDNWILGVKDNGTGIDPDYQEQIFEPFEYLDDGQQRSTGIGLSICQRIVQRHDGEIWVDSEPGEGAHFQFTLQPREATT